MTEEADNMYLSHEQFNMIREMFPYKGLQTIKQVVSLIYESSPTDSDDFKLENIINLLCETGHADNEEELNNEAAGYSLDYYLEMLKNVFPNACPTFLREFCQKRLTTSVNVESLIEELSRSGFPKKEIDPQETFINLCEMLPNADPSYLKKRAYSLANKSENDLKEFIENMLEKQDYPTLEEFRKRQKSLNEKKAYTTEFSLKLFLEKFPDPETYFSNSDRENPVFASQENEESQNQDEKYAFTFLLNHYAYLRTKDIEKVFKMKNKNLYHTCLRLNCVPRCLKTARRKLPQDFIPDNIPLLQEIAYLKHRKLILSVLKQQDEKYKLSKEEARKNNLLQTCVCCYDDELIPEECYFCSNGCIFCKYCIKKGVETSIGEGKLYFPCFANCEGEFNLSTLQMVLDQTVFLRMFQRRQIEEIKKAKLEGLEMCPFCDFASIPVDGDKIFNCLNPDCMKKSCRECRHEEHTPLHCNEIEYDEDVRIRTYIEDKMTQALLRECYQCKKKFIKESGCNKMTCSCGAKMCYICKQPVRDYNHFGDRGKCPLYTQDLDNFHKNAVIQGGNQAKSELGVDRDPNKLKKDPMADIK